MSVPADIMITMELVAMVIMSVTAVGSCLAAWATYFEQRRKYSSHPYVRIFEQASAQFIFACRIS